MIKLSGSGRAEDGVADQSSEARENPPGDGGPVAQSSSLASVPLPVAGGPRAPGEFDLLIRLTLALFVIGVGVWLLLAGRAYRRDYSGAGVAWHRGAKNFVELTLVRDDRSNLACASDVTMQGLRCGFGANQRPEPSLRADDDRSVLRPYNTVNGELFLGAGLWDTLAPQGALPPGRFTVTCDLEIVGAVRSVALRWSPGGRFDAATKTLAVGTLRDCAIPP